MAIQILLALSSTTTRPICKRWHPKCFSQQVVRPPKQRQYNGPSSTIRPVVTATNEVNLQGPQIGFTKKTYKECKWKLFKINSVEEVFATFVVW